MQGTTTEAVAPASQSAYLIAGQQFRTDSSGFAEAIAAAHAEHHRPRCLCLRDGIEMYVARLGNGFIVKRMPNTGSQHAPHCLSYEPPPEFSGLGQVLGSAINEDPATGETTLKLGFSLSRIGGRSTVPAPGSVADSAVSDGTKLSLRGLLHYLWDQAELTRWHPGFAGKRSWATVRRHLLQAAENKIACGGALDARLYIPEVFSVEHRDAISVRRMAHWAHAITPHGKPQHLMLLIAEVKEIVPARYGFKAVVKHVPDQSFALEEQLYRRLGRRFESELALWGAADTLRMLMIATFGVSEGGMPTIEELSLMPVSSEWLPIEDLFDQQLIETLTRQRRSFVKSLRYNLPSERVLANAILTDTGERPIPLYVTHPSTNSKDMGLVAGDFESGAWPAWNWRVGQLPLPQLPSPCRPQESAQSSTLRPSITAGGGSPHRPSPWHPASAPRHSWRYAYLWPHNTVVLSSIARRPRVACGRLYRAAQTGQNPLAGAKKRRFIG